MTEPYIPKGAVSLNTITVKSQIRLGIQGYGKTGKTWAALTFPNPIVLNLDRGLGAHIGRSDVYEIPFYKPEFAGKFPGELKDKLMEWLKSEGTKITESQTLIFDGCTSLQNAYHKWFDVNQHMFLTKQGKVDDYAEYRVKRVYFAELFEFFKTLKCDVIFIAHESAQKDKGTQEYTGKIRPLLSGQFNDELLNHCTDWFRQHTASKVLEPKPDTLKNFGMTLKEFMDWQSTFPRDTIYYWQSDSDNIFDGGCSSLVNFPKYLPANFSTFAKYQKTNKTTETNK